MSASNYGLETDLRLQPNQVYTVTLKIKDKKNPKVFVLESSFSFTSRYTPLFSSVRLIRSDYRDLLSVYTTDDINMRIHENSLAAMELAASSTNSVSINPAVPDGVPHVVKQYVRFKTELDLATDLFLTLSTKAGQEDKTLGDMRINKQISFSALKDVLALLQKKVDAWETQLVGVKGGSPTSAVRAGATVYSLAERVSF